MTDPTDRRIAAPITEGISIDMKPHEGLGEEERRAGERRTAKHGAAHRVSCYDASGAKTCGVLSVLSFTLQEHRRPDSDRRRAPVMRVEDVDQIMDEWDAAPASLDTAPTPESAFAERCRMKIYDLWHEHRQDFGQAHMQGFVRDFIANSLLQFAAPTPAQPAGAREPNEVRVCGKHVIAFATGDCDLCAASVPVPATPAMDEVFSAIQHELYRGRTAVNFGHVPEVSRAIDWLSQDFKVLQSRLANRTAPAREGK